MGARTDLGLPGLTALMPAAPAEMFSGGAVHVWYVLPKQRAEFFTQFFDTLLGPEERERAARFHFPEDRLSYVCAHGLQRLMLTKLLGTHAPPEWKFDTGLHGRPALAGEQTGIHVSLSHTRGLVASAVATVDVGVDVESNDRRAPLHIAHGCFAPAELDDLLARPAGQQPQRFFYYWTLKEAYLKARGTGLSQPLRSVCISDLPAGEIDVAVTPDWDDHARWYFESHAIASRFRLAVCAGRQAAAPTVSIQEFSPPDRVPAW